MLKFLDFEILVLLVVLYNLYQVEAENVFLKTFKNLHKDPGPKGSPRARVETKWIEQKLDHFNEMDNRTWQMVRKGIKNENSFKLQKEDKTVFNKF